MKYFLLIILSLILLPDKNLMAQDYQIFLTNRFYIYEYEISGTGHLAVFKADTVKLNGVDTVFYNYTRANDDNTTGIAANTIQYYSDTSWSGYKCIIKTSGENILLNGRSDSLIFKTNSHLNDSWDFCLLANGDKFVANVISHDLDSVFGIPDSIKTISINRFDSSGNPVPDSLNNFEFRLSKNYGLLKTVNIKHFPYSSIVYSMKGIDSIAGDQRFTPQTMFDFNIGDEYHYSGSRRVSLSITEIKHEKKIILAKNIFPNYVSYSIMDSVLIKTYDGSVNISTSFNANIINEIHLFNIYTHDSLFSTLPYKKSWGPGYLTTWHSRLNGRRYIQTVACVSRINTTIPTAVHQGLANCVGNYCTFPGAANIFLEGVGLFSSHADVDSGLTVYFCNVDLVYYLKGTEVYGSPVNFSLITDINEIGKNRVQSYPNPSDKTATLKYTGDQPKVKLYNLQMQEIEVEKQFYNQEIVLSLENLVSGTYFVTFINNNDCTTLPILVQH